MTETTKTVGQAAYEAYAGSTGWKSAISGAALPQWDAQAEAVRAAWEAAGKAARAWIAPPLPVVPFDEARVYKPEELRFSARARCRCGAGLAYDKDSHDIRGAWRCAAAMMHTLPTPDPFDGQHVELPFMFYEIKSEDQPSAQGATTRPS